MGLILTETLLQSNKGKIILWDDKKEKHNSWEAYIVGYDGEVKAEGFGWTYEEAKENAIQELKAKIKELELASTFSTKIIY